MALYTYKSREEALRPFTTYNGDSNWVRQQMASLGYGPSQESTQVYDAIGRTAGAESQDSGSDNFFTKRFKSLENAFGTTGAAAIGGINELIANEDRNGMRKDQKTRMNDIAKKYGYSDYHEVWDARDRAKETNDTKTLDLIDNVINPQLKAQANENAEEMTDFANKYKDYTQNDYIGKKVNQDRGKFAGSAMNTLSTMADVMSLGAGVPASVAVNATQGAVEGIADELEQNGGMNSQNIADWFGPNGVNWGQAGQNALVGGLTGAATGALNKGMNSALAKNGGNLFKGGNALTRGINKLGSSTAVGRVGSTLATGAGRGAVSGAVGGALGAGLSSALNGVDAEQGIANALQGAVQGAGQGAMTGGIMTGANMAADAALNKFNPNLAKAIQENQAKNMAYGDKLSDQFKGAWNSGESIGAEGIKAVASKIGSISNKTLGNSSNNIANNTIVQPDNNLSMEAPEEVVEQDIQTTQTTAEPLDSWDKIAQESGYRTYDEAIESFMKANPNAKLNENGAAGQILAWMEQNPGDYNADAITQKVNTDTKKDGVLTSEQIKNKRALVEEITKQFNAVDKPTARATKPNETFYNLYEDWGLSDGDDIRQAISYGDQGALIPQMIREAAGEAGVIDLTDAQGLVMDLKINKKNYGKYVNALEEIMDSTETTILGGKAGVDALQLQRTLEAMASDARGTNGTYRIGNTVVDETMARNFERIASNIGDKLDEAAVSKGVVKNVLSRHANDIQNMRNAFPENTKWQNKIDTDILGANTIRDLRHSIKDFTRANIFIRNGDENYATFGGRYAANNLNVPTTKAGVINRTVNYLVDKAAELPVVRNAKLNKYDKGIRGTDTATTNVDTTTTANNVTPTNINPGTQLFNAIGRTEGISNMTDQTGQELSATSGYAEPLSATTTVPATTLESLASPTTSAATNVYDAISGNTYDTASQNIPTFDSEEEERAVYFFRPTGDAWTDMLSRAMRRAKNAEDYKSLGTLFEMYQSALESYQKSNMANTAQSLNASQQAQLAKLDAADSAIDELERLFNSAGGGKGNIRGNLQSLAGNWGLDSNAKTYNDMAEGLVNQISAAIGKTDSLNTEGEVKRALKLIPQLTDDATTAQNKLEELRRMLATTKASYNAAYGLQ